MDEPQSSQLLKGCLLMVRPVLGQLTGVENCGLCMGWTSPIWPQQWKQTDSVHDGCTHSVFPTPRPGGVPRPRLLSGPVWPLPCSCSWALTRRLTTTCLSQELRWCSGLSWLSSENEGGRKSISLCGCGTPQGWCRERWHALLICIRKWNWDMSFGRLTQVLKFGKLQL